MTGDAYARCGACGWKADGLDDKETAERVARIHADRPDCDGRPTVGTDDEGEVES